MIAALTAVVDVVLAVMSVVVQLSAHVVCASDIATVVTASAAAVELVDIIVLILLAPVEILVRFCLIKEICCQCGASLALIVGIGGVRVFANDVWLAATASAAMSRRHKPSTVQGAAVTWVVLVIKTGVTIGISIRHRVSDPGPRPPTHLLIGRGC